MKINRRRGIYAPYGNLETAGLPPMLFLGEYTRACVCDRIKVRAVES